MSSPYPKSPRSCSGSSWKSGTQKFLQLLGLTNSDSKRNVALDLTSGCTAGSGCPNTFSHPHRCLLSPQTPLAEILYVDLEQGINNYPLPTPWVCWLSWRCPGRSEAHTHQRHICTQGPKALTQLGLHLLNSHPSQPALLSMLRASCRLWPPYSCNPSSFPQAKPGGLREEFPK